MISNNSTLKIAAAIIATFNSFSAFGADRACLIEGTIVVFGKSIAGKDCLENSGSSDDQFKSVCQSISKTSENMAKTFGGAAPKTTYMQACPPKATATCLGYFGQPMTSYYYLRDAVELSKTKESCLATGGKWKQ